MGRGVLTLLACVKPKVLPWHLVQLVSDVISISHILGNWNNMQFLCCQAVVYSEILHPCLFLAECSCSLPDPGDPCHDTGSTVRWHNRIHGQSVCLHGLPAIQHAGKKVLHTAMDLRVTGKKGLVDNFLPGLYRGRETSPGIIAACSVGVGAPGLILTLLLLPSFSGRTSCQPSLARIPL